jgi:hypothetical protein
MKSSAWWPSAILVAPTPSPSVQHAAAQARAERARGRVGVEDVLDHLADAGVLDAVLPAAALRRCWRSRRACIPCSRSRR